MGLHAENWYGWYFPHFNAIIDKDNGGVMSQSGEGEISLNDVHLIF